MKGSDPQPGEHAHLVDNRTGMGNFIEGCIKVKD